MNTSETINLTTDAFDYNIPADLIAQQPLAKRSDSRLLVYEKGTIIDKRFEDIVTLLPQKSLLILNDSKVIPGRLMGQTVHGGTIELMLLEPTSRSTMPNDCSSTVWKSIGKPMKKLKIGTHVYFAGNLEGTILSKNDQGPTITVQIEFNQPYPQFLNWLEKYGYIPLPPYIKRERPTPASVSSDRDRYQTVFAEHQGSVAAPTAGLHMTSEILAKIRARGIDIASVTLHVGGGTFLPVKTNQISDHHMHNETFKIPSSTFEKIKYAQENQIPIITMGTTSFRALQGFKDYLSRGDAAEYVDRWLSTDIFIHPKTKDDIFEPWAVNGIITNFHQPKSTLFMMICALLGFENALSLYKHAISKQYRFFSYGDSSLLWF